MRIHSALVRSTLCIALLLGPVPMPAAATARPSVPAATPAPHRASASAADHVLVRFKQTGRAALGGTLERNGLSASDVRRGKRGPAHVNVPKGTTRDRLLAQLKADPNVAYAEPDYQRQVLAYLPPNDPAWLSSASWTSGETSEQFAKSWWLRANGLAAEAAWTHGFSDPADRDFPVRAPASAFKVGVIDTGFYMSHPDRGGVSAGHDYFDRYDNGAFIEDNDVNPPPKTAVGYRVMDFSHGTCTAGEVAAATRNAQGVASVGYDAQAVVYKVMGIDVRGVTGVPAGGVTILSEPLIAAIYGAADDGCRVISISLGGDEFSQAEQDAVEYAWAKGCVVVAATGNDGVNGAMYPARYDHVLGVGSFSSSAGVKTRSGFTNYGDGLDVLAPGDLVWGLTDPTYTPSYDPGSTGYAFWSGTSMATPAAAGALAHLWRYVPGLTNEQISDLVERTATPAGGPRPNGDYGWGYMSMASAIASITATYPYLAAPVLDVPDMPAAGDYTIGWNAVAGHGVVYDVWLDGSRVATTTATSQTLAFHTGHHELRVQATSALDYFDAASMTTTYPLAGTITGAAPTDSWAGFAPPGLVASATPVCSVQARDVTSGLIPESAEFRYTADGGSSWSSWLPATLDCWRFADTTQTISAAVPFAHDSDVDDQVQFRVTNGSSMVGTSPVFTVRVDASPPAGTVIIGGASAVTSSAEVPVHASLTDAHAITMRFSGDGGATWTTPAPFSAEVTVTMPQARGPHTVRAEYRDAAGNLLAPSRTMTLQLPITIARLGGSDRYETALLTSRAHFTSADTVVLATGKRFADALSASALAGSYGAPLLLTPPTAMYAGLPGEIARLGATRVLVVGGPASVETAVLDAIETSTGIVPRRIAGTDRYDTSKEVALEVIAHEQSLGHAVPTEFFLARGDEFPDALALSPLAFSQRMPIVLTQPNAILPSTLAAIQALQPDPHAGRIIIAGGTPSVGSAVTNQLNAQGRDWIRVYGPTRYDTAAAVAAYGVTRGWAAWRYAGVATGESFPDALGGGVAAGAGGGVVLLTKRSPISSQCLTMLQAHQPTLLAVDVFGGQPTIAEGVVDSIRALF